MYGKEGSASGLANLQNEDHCPPAEPRRGQGRGLGARLGSFCRSVCASVLGGQRCSGLGAVGSSRSFGPSCLRALGRVGGGPSGCGGLGGSEAAGFWGKRVSLGAEQTGGVVTAFAELTKAGCAGEFYAGSWSGIAGRRSLPVLCRLRACGRRRPRCRGLAREPVLGAWSRRPWMDLPSACPCRPWDPSSRTSRYALRRDERERRC